jgi:Zn finger protein HypA/HybF involved in hydrogenase expression
MGKNIIIKKEQAEEIVKNCYSIADFCRAIGWQPRGDNYKIFHRYVKEYNLDISHFTGQKSNIGNKLNFKNELSAKDYAKSKCVRGQTLIKKLLKENIKERKCESCGLTEWKGEEIPLELHHIDGNHFNNDLDNLQLLCPNCHSLTDTYCGRKNKTEHKCKECGKEISRWSNSGLCSDCTKKKQRKVERPSLEELEKLLSNNSYVAVGKMFNVSDNTIRKWIKNYKKSS